MANEIQGAMTPAQYQAFSDRCAKQIAASTYAAQQAVLSKALDKGLDKGADSPALMEKGLRTKVQGESSSISPLTLIIGFAGNTVSPSLNAPSTLAANVFSWYDLYPPINLTTQAPLGGSGSAAAALASTITGAAAQLFVTPANLAAGGLGSQAPNSVGAAAGTPSWLSVAGANSQGLNPLQQYQLVVVYCAQNIAQCESLNVQSSEAAPAPIINSGQATEYYNSPFIAATNNTVVFSNATEPSDFKTNQILVLLEMTMSLLHFVQLTTSTPNFGPTLVTVNATFHVRYGERRGQSFKEKIATMPGKAVPTRSARKALTA